MRWEQLLFLHWKWEAGAIQRTLPRGLTVDTFDGSAWVGLVPFFMRDVRPAFVPSLPGISDFLELNVRTYVVDAQGRPGVWFYSLDCDRWPAVKTARTVFHLNYQHAEMSATMSAAGEVDYRTRRRGEITESRLVYRASSGTAPAIVGSLEFFLIERYRLFAHDPRRDRLFAGRVWHEPYRIGGASVAEWDDVMLRLNGFNSGGRAPDHVCAAEPVDVRVFPPERVNLR
jgi:uncharacterized protein